MFFLRKIKVKANNKFEINDLIDDAISNAVARRNTALSTVSEEKAKNITGGIISSPVILGGITIGLVALPTTTIE
jgi:hypothetical protein